MQLLNALPPGAIVLGDKAYDGDAIRRSIEEQGAVPNIPPKANRRWKSCFSKVLYRGGSAIERMFCRLKDWRRIDTTTSSPPTSWPQSASPLPSHGGYEPRTAETIVRPLSINPPKAILGWVRDEES